MIKQILLLVVVILIVGLITLTGGEITKLFVKANKCHRTKTLLFFSGLITALILALIGGLYYKVIPAESRDKFQNWALTEQFRYTSSQAKDAADKTKGLAEEYRYADSQAEIAAKKTLGL